jgi:hypothetical protein
MGADKTGDFVWVCDWWGGNLAKIDIRTQKATLVPLPRPDAQQPYQAAVDSHHNVWTNLMGGDEVLKFDPKTSQWTEYQLPTLGAETRYFSLLERDGSMQVILPYSKDEKSCANDVPHSGSHASAEKADAATGTGEHAIEKAHRQMG